jgi:hypothetical protein
VLTPALLSTCAPVMFPSHPTPRPLPLLVESSLYRLHAQSGALVAAPIPCTEYLEQSTTT